MTPLPFTFFISDACRALPEGYELRLCFSKGKMDVYLYDDRGKAIDFFTGDKCGDVGYCQHAINAARDHAGLHHFYHENSIDTSVLNTAD